MNADSPYEDDDFVEDYKLPTLVPDEFKFGIRHNRSRNLFWVTAKNQQELAEKINVADWQPDPRNEPPVDEGDDEG